MAKMTPMMKQYFEIKEQYPDAILLFRLGDFYEMFFDDAKLASRELELVLTGRDWGREERAPMCGVPHHSADSYIARLVAKGYKVAICEQTQDVSEAKGLVERAVVRVLTPGTVIESSMLEEGKNNYMASLCVDGTTAGLCFVDISTGTVHLTQVETEEPDAVYNEIIGELGHFLPSEIVYREGDKKLESTLKAFSATRAAIAFEVLPQDAFGLPESVEALAEHFVEDFKSSEIRDKKQALRALGTALEYLKAAHKADLKNLNKLEFYTSSNFMRLDYSTRRNLELIETMRGRDKKGSLLWVIDKTKTPMGKRLIRSWLEQPLMSIAQISKRHNAVEGLLENPILRHDIITAFSPINDLERLITRIVYETANAKELRSLSQTIRALPAIKTAIEPCKAALINEVYRGLDLMEDVLHLVETAIVEDPPFSVREGGIINDGYNSDLDDLREISNNGKAFIAAIEAQEQEKTGIKKLKIGYNRVFGYYLEVPNSFKADVPEEYIRKQTLTNCERYITQELKDLEGKVLGAQERIVKLEFELFCQVRSQVAEHFKRVQTTAQALATLDSLCSLAQVAANNNYVCPQMIDGDKIEIKDGRHPVVELMLDDAPFVPNDTLLDCEKNRCSIITGPNMAGKSTYMRQVALISLLAQMGSFVPAAYAEICIVDGIYTRIGASDDLSSGRSTFMVEMSEVADILHQASQKSLVIFDEIGRGTSTFDGMSIARAVIEHTADPKKLGAKTLFATHYHELTELEDSIDGIKNYNIAVKKRGDDITFLRRIVPGGADGSYGIEVAKLAGIPSSVVSRARSVLEEIEKNEGFKIFQTQAEESEEENFTSQLSFTAKSQSLIVEDLKKLDVNTLTPIEALGILYDLVKEAEKCE
ncbi:MAG: DNA mismatch repair protein MutS [Clostridiales bacterium]|nr:DNA mismatch repair protein MutS [Clostridiales bacterium]